MKNLKEHYGLPVVVGINGFASDTDAERKILKDKSDELEVPIVSSTHHANGGEGAKELAEKVVQVIDDLLTELASQPELFSLVNEERLDKNSWLFDRKVKTSFIQKLPFGISHVQQYLPLLPFAIEQLDLEGYPLVISSSHLVAKGILTSPDQLHISYIHTPVRYAWDQMNIYLKRSFLRKIGLGPLIRWQLHTLRQWDQLSSSRVDYLLANSNFTAKRIWKYGN